MLELWSRLHGPVLPGTALPPPGDSQPSEWGTHTPPTVWCLPTHTMGRPCFQTDAPEHPRPYERQAALGRGPAYLVADKKWGAGKGGHRVLKACPWPSGQEQLEQRVDMRQQARSGKEAPPMGP